MDDNVAEEELSLEEFVKLPTTLTFNAINTIRFRRFVEENPYIRVGTELGTGYVPFYINENNVERILDEFRKNWLLTPAILSGTDIKANNAAGITPILNQPYLDISGNGVIIGIIDSGIDYTKEVFQYADGTSKIVSIWDQTLEGDKREGLYFGAEYTNAQINEALASPTPYDIVPTRDVLGHGTFLSSVAAGSKTENYIGAAPDAKLVVVKLRRISEYFIERFLVEPNKPDLYHNADVMLGMDYVVKVANEQNAPVVICLGLGSNDTGHDGYTQFEEYINFLAQRPGYSVVTSAGNESNAKHHTQGKLEETGAVERIGISVGQQRASFQVNLFGEAPDKITVAVVSPTGDMISRVPFKVGDMVIEQLLFEQTTIYITYYQEVSTLITIGFENAVEGIWEIIVYGDSILNGEYHAWLPITGQVSPNVVFTDPVPEYTTVYPANSLRAIITGSYNSEDGSLAASSSWGPTRLPRMAPDLVAPGVNIRGVYPTGFGTMSGTSVAAAVTAGAVALLLQWGIVEENMPAMDSDVIRLMLIAGCDRDKDMEYPNNQWGYGSLNLYQTFLGLRDSRETFTDGF